jgi:hypothetical protein
MLHDCTWWLKVKYKSKTGATCCGACFSKKNPCFQPGAYLLNKNVKYKSETVPTSYDACSQQKKNLHVPSSYGACLLKIKKDRYCPHLSCDFFRNTVQTQALTYMRIHSPLWTHARTSFPYEHLRKTKLADRVLRLTKSPQVPRYRWVCRLPLKGYSAFMRHTDVKPGVWTLVGWGYNHPPNRRTSGWFSIMWYIRWPRICIWARFAKTT